MKNRLFNGYIITDSIKVSPGEEYVIGVKSCNGFLQYGTFKCINGTYQEGNYYLNRDDAAWDVETRVKNTKQAYNQLRFYR